MTRGCSSKRSDVTLRLEADLWRWRMECKNSGKAVSKRLAQARARWAFHKEGFTEFKASDGWYWKWLSRWKTKPREILQEEEEPKELVNENSNAGGRSPSSPLSCDFIQEAKDYLSLLKALQRVPDENGVQQQENGSSLFEDTTSFELNEALQSLEGDQLKRDGGGDDCYRDGGNDLDEEELVIANCVDVHAAEDGGGRGLETLLASLLAPEEGEECGNVATNAGATASAGSSSVSSSACRFHMPLGIPAAAAESGGESAPEKLERGQIFAGRGSLEELREAEEKHQENGQQDPYAALTFMCSPSTSPSPSLTSLGSTQWSPSLASSSSSPNSSFLVSSSSNSPWSSSVSSIANASLLMPLPCDPHERTCKKLSETWSSSPPSYWSSSSSTGSSSCKSLPLSPSTASETSLTEGVIPSQQRAKNDKPLTAIALHRRRGAESLRSLKALVCNHHAQGHTYKETARAFGIHHSTVSGWVKSRKMIGLEERDVSLRRPRPDELFVQWLTSCREVELSAKMVDEKLDELLGGGEELDKLERRCKWLVRWKERRQERQYVEGMEDDMHARRDAQNLSYPARFKLEVALYARRHSQYAAAKVFAVARRRIFDWVRQIKRLEHQCSLTTEERTERSQDHEETSPTSGGRGPRDRDVDVKVYEWFCAKREAGQRPKSSQVQAEARALYRSSGHSDMKCSYGWFKRWSRRFQLGRRFSYDEELLSRILPHLDANEGLTQAQLQDIGRQVVGREEPDFKASAGWAMRFCRRHRLLLNPSLSPLAAPSELHQTDSGFHHSPGHMDFSHPRLPIQLEEQATKFIARIHQIADALPVSRIGCMDELSFNFAHVDGSSSARSRDQKSTTRASVLLRHAGMANAKAVVLLAATGDGTLLPPLVVTKNYEPTQSESDKHHLLVSSHTVTQWLTMVWLKHVGGGKSLVLWDSFAPHLEVSSSMDFDDVLTESMPPGCAIRLQPLLMGIKHKFKSIVDNLYLSRRGSEQNNRPPVLDDIVQWVDQAFQTLRQDKKFIVDSFVRAGVLQTEKVKLWNETPARV